MFSETAFVTAFQTFEFKVQANVPRLHLELYLGSILITFITYIINTYYFYSKVIFLYAFQSERNVFRSNLVRAKVPTSV